MANHYAESAPIALQTVSYIQAASAAAFFFDFCITFSSEVRWTWGRKWGIVRIAFVIFRYLPIIGFAITMLPLSRQLSEEFQLLLLEVIIILTGAAARALFVTRTYAFCALEKRIVIAISLFSTVVTATAVTIVIVVESDPGDVIQYDGVFEEERHLSICYGLLAIHEIGLMSLTMHKRFKFYRQQNTPLIATVYRDGMFYMLWIVLASVANCIGFLVLPLSYASLFTSPQLVLQSVLASRILFNLRATNELPDDVLIWPVASGMVFAPIQTPSGADRLDLLDITDL
ncbi:hypothetical protein DEU56DRAFT_919625 [Suillus clintonianus]|uniref:uncharacterized protein n=1 Tax=Suillus clintonianus TaxID=1904413 RepID=UPI001B88179E|nr:uncharacterized protein DEU56DRAFT_919625 [Suillus clintonianus]KAG2114126.1 hypothetical protein DEU56DRAFT_919625 [Suillus clintonianus]